MASHGALVRRLGATEPALAELLEFEQSVHFTEAEKAALAVAQAMTQNAKQLPQPIWERLRRHYTDEQIIEIVCSIGIFNYFNRVNNALEMEVTR